MEKCVGFVDGVEDEPYFGKTPEEVLQVVTEACRKGDLELNGDDELLIYKLSESHRYESEPKFKKIGTK